MIVREKKEKRMNEREKKLNMCNNEKEKKR